MNRLLDRLATARLACLLIAISGCAGSRSRDVSIRTVPQSDVESNLSTTDTQRSVSQAEEPDVVSDDSIQLVSEETASSEDAATEDDEPTATLSLNYILQLAESQNPNIALAQERIQEAYARVDRADALWLPSLRAGMNYHHHDGRIQDVAGKVIETTRSSMYGGFGANAVGAGSPAVPGLIASFHLVDAIYQPRIAGHQAASRQFAAAAAKNDVLRDAAVAYLELLRAEHGTAIAREALSNTRKLTDLTMKYAESGQGLQADFQRMEAELALSQEQLEVQIEVRRVASARLAQLLHADATVVISAAEQMVVPLEIMTLDGAASKYVATGLSRRPELCEHRHLVCEAVERWKREKYAPLVPSVLLGLSYGGLAGGLGSTLGNAGDRMDADAVAYWELRNLGVGDYAAQSEAASSSRQAQLRQVAALDRVAREVTEAYSQVVQRQKRIPLSKAGITAAEKSYNLNLQRIENAQGLPIETLQAIHALKTARRSYLNAVIDYNIAQFDLCRATGWFIDDVSVDQRTAQQN